VKGRIIDPGTSAMFCGSRSYYAPCTTTANERIAIFVQADGQREVAHGQAGATSRLRFNAFRVGAG